MLGTGRAGDARREQELRAGPQLFQRNEFTTGNGAGNGGGASTLSHQGAAGSHHHHPARTAIGRAFWHEIDLVVDLGAQIGSKTWWRGLVTCTALCGATILMAPSVEAIPALPSALDQDQVDEARAQAITPLAFGADTGRRMAATDVVEPLADTPERPHIEMTATLGRGDGFTRVLERAGVSGDQAEEITSLIEGIIPLADIRPGTPMTIILGRRPNRTVARPVDHIAFRARFDLKIELDRVDGSLRVNPIQIAVDDTPLRIRGRVGASLYRSARAAGAPPSAIQEYLRAIGTQMSINDIGSDATFDLIVEHRRAETGETEMGRLIYAGVERGDRKTQLLRWSVAGTDQWFEASGVGRSTGEMLMPVNGRLTSPFGYRRHPILGYRRLHTGLDIAAGHGTPIRAAASGTVNYSGRNGGYGNYVRIAHSGGIQTAYAHMSRIAVSSGTRVTQGQVIGYVGSTGMSTGPHLHYEMIRGGQKIDPRSVRYIENAQLSGPELQRFRSTLAGLMQVEPGAALARRERPRDLDTASADQPRRADRSRS
ncbi:M23 family metallopeptidase [uncultured Parasphingopyxis sp.]|uniref:M23 family metallopeptidase n=2 Tax=Parasphingopyxis TaxID=1234545 RepID=UPI002632A38E|nr:M23 family metallopeptidase [uncultured Parasphingopyxis sp.]